jgi:hypothetical protein
MLSAAKDLTFCAIHAVGDAFRDKGAEFRRPRRPASGNALIVRWQNRSARRPPMSDPRLCSWSAQQPSE